MTEPTKLLIEHQLYSRKFFTRRQAEHAPTHAQQAHAHSKKSREEVDEQHRNFFTYNPTHIQQTCSQSEKLCGGIDERRRNFFTHDTAHTQQTRSQSKELCGGAGEYQKNFFTHDASRSEQNPSRPAAETQRLAAQFLLEKIFTVNYMQRIDFKDYSAEFFQAGHIPGAMMTLMNFNERRILYTGDYSLHSTALTGGCILPENLEVDTLIMCGLHAKHPNYRRQSDNLYHEINAVFHWANLKKNVVCRISQLSKGIEFIKILNSRNKNHFPIFIDNEIMNIVRIMDKLAEPVLNADNHPINELSPDETGIIITSSSSNSYANAIDFKIHFSLHEDFDDMKNFITTLNPRQAVIVHCSPAHSEEDFTIEQEIMMNCDCRTQFIFAENGQLYNL